MQHYTHPTDDQSCPFRRKYNLKSDCARKGQCILRGTWKKFVGHDEREHSISKHTTQPRHNAVPLIKNKPVTYGAKKLAKHGEPRSNVKVDLLYQVKTTTSKSVDVPMEDISDMKGSKFIATPPLRIFSDTSELWRVHRALAFAWNWLRYHAIMHKDGSVHGHLPSTVKFQGKCGAYEYSITSERNHGRRYTITGLELKHLSAKPEHRADWSFSSVHMQSAGGTKFVTVPIERSVTVLGTVHKHS